MTRLGVRDHRRDPARPWRCPGPGPARSKVGFATLVARLAAAGYVLIDCQVPTAHLASLGAFAVDRAEFLAAVHIFRDQPPSGDAFVTPASDAT